MCFYNSFFKHFLFCYYKVKMGDECDKQFNLENFAFDEENHE